MFRILIASPSDVTEERDIAVRIIQEWNDLNSAERQIVLLPVRWETHSAPEYGRRPQEIINRQIVDQADLLIAVFWTRIGSPTGVADSGTLEEIERVAMAGKPVMLYFSQARQEPDRIDLDQLKQLRAFKDKTFPRALVEHFGSQVDFRDKLAKQLEIQVRGLLAADSEGESGSFAARPVTDVQLAFADPESGEHVGRRLTISSVFLDITDTDKIPDFGTPSPKKAKDESSFLFTTTLDRENKNYYRETVEFIRQSNFFRPVRFWLKNVGAVGARDVYIDIRMASDAGLVAATLGEVRLTPPTKSSGLLSWPVGSSRDSDMDDALEQRGASWTTHLDVAALQPQRELSPPTEFVLGMERSGLLTFTVRIYADTLADPLTDTLEVEWQVEHRTVSALDLLKDELPRPK